VQRVRHSFRPWPNPAIARERGSPTTDHAPLKFLRKGDGDLDLAATRFVRLKSVLCAGPASGSAGTPHAGSSFLTLFTCLLTAVSTSAPSGAGPIKRAASAGASFQMVNRAQYG
jgi:hypothetical protein